MTIQAPDTKEMKLLTEFLRKQDLSLDPEKMIQAMESAVSAMRPNTPLDPWEVVADLRRLSADVCGLRASLGTAEVPANQAKVALGRTGSRLGWSMPAFPSTGTGGLSPLSAAA